MRNRVCKFAVAPALLASMLFVPDASAQQAYVRSEAAGAPWGETTNEEAMDLVFGAGNWDDLRFETVDPAVLFSNAYTFVYLEGSDAGATELEAFLAANQPALEAWASAGGGVFLNAAPNEDDGMAYGFGGVTLTYNDTSANPGSAVDPAHAIWIGPNLPTATSFTGNNFAHATVAGNPALIPLIQDSGGKIHASELPAWGCGLGMFGGLTTTNWWTPTLESANLRANMIAYLDAGASMPGAEDTCPGNTLDIATLTPGSTNSVSGGGSTVCAFDDIDEAVEIACWVGSSALEHVHSFTPATTVFLQVDLENSLYDTKLALTNGCPDGANFCVYNDDYDFGAGLVLQSGFDCQEFTGGTTYSAIVSGFGGSIGDYSLNLTECTPQVCGDTIIVAPETCDDGGESATCDDDCTAAACGDGNFNATSGEECDDGGESATCDDDCTAVACGDGNFNAAAGEECDDGAGSAICDADCTLVSCGDGTVNVAAGEVCDDGGESATCDDDCSDVVCGDGNANSAAGEACDDSGESATCDDDCTDVACGDGTANAMAGEDCDDSGESATCNDDCTNAACGDGIVNATAGEDCDDGNTTDGDGCASDCTTEGTGGSGTGGSGSGGDGTGNDGTGNSGTGGSGSDTDASDDGCGCSTPGSSPRGAGWAGAAALLGLLAMRRRRRRQ